MRRDKVRLACLVSHPIQYQAPLFRLLAQRPELDFKVFFLHQTSVETHFDKGFGRAISWDVPLLEGYDHEILPARQDPGKRLKDAGFQVLWMHGWAHAANLRAMRAAKRLGMKVLLRGESNLLNENENGWKPPLKRLFLRWCFDRVDGFLCIGSLNREFYRRHGVEESRLFSVPYAVDNAFFQRRVAEARPGREIFRESLGFEKGRPTILFTGKLLPHKGPMDLLEAYIRLSPDGGEPVPYLVFAGSGTERERLRRRALETGWSSIRFLGFQNQTELPRVFDLCDLFVMPSHTEPWGLVVNEVMNAGKPVIVSDAVGSARDLVASGENGWLFQSGNVGALNQALRSALANPGNLEAMGKNSLNRIGRWSFREDIDGLLHAAEEVRLKA